MPATVIAERVGWTGSGTWFRENVKQLRPEHRRVDPADRLVREPGDAAQCDLWFPPKKIPLEDGTAKLLPALVIAAAHSRFMTGQMIPTRKTQDLLLGSWELIQQIGRVLRRLIWDNEPGIGRGQRRAQGVAAFMGTLATKLVLLPPKALLAPQPLHLLVIDGPALTAGVVITPRGNLHHGCAFAYAHSQVPKAHLGQMESDPSIGGVECPGSARSPDTQTVH